MPIFAEWYNEEKTILVQKYVGTWILDDVYTVAEKTWHMLDTVQHPVALISDFSMSKTIPPRLLTMTSSISKKVHPNRGALIIVAAGLFLKTLIQSGAALAPKALGSTLYAETLDEAVHMVKVNEYAA